MVRKRWVVVMIENFKKIGKKKKKKNNRQKNRIKRDNLLVKEGVQPL